MLCQFAKTFPHFVARFLAQGQTLKRRFREETVTDLLMGGLITAAGGKLIVEFPNEPVTGADMEWNFVDRRSRTFFRILLQAKQAYGGGEIWSRHAYRELYHKSGKGPHLQAQTLCDTARTSPATYPLYIFYNSQTTLELAAARGVRHLQGINIADGYEIERLVLFAKGRKLQTRNRSVGTISPLLESLSSLFCPEVIYPTQPSAFAGSSVSFAVSQDDRGRPFVGIPIPPDPHTVRDRLVQISKATRVRTDFDEASVGTREKPGVPEVSYSIPEEIEELLESRGTRGLVSRPLDRWRLTFMSTRSPDHRIG